MTSIDSFTNNQPLTTNYYFIMAAPTKDEKIVLPEGAWVKQLSGGNNV